jgi:ketosteroid isomerase-like protein
MHVAEVANAYFNAVRSRDAEALRKLFAPDAELVTATGAFRGADAIADYYAELAFSIEPDPTLGPFIVDGDRLAVEIDLATTIGPMQVADVFTIAGDQITRLAIYGVGNLRS